MSRRCGTLVSALQGLGKNAQVDPKPQGPPSECPGRKILRFHGLRASLFHKPYSSFREPKAINPKPPKRFAAPQQNRKYTQPTSCRNNSASCAQVATSRLLIWGRVLLAIPFCIYRSTFPSLCRPLALLECRTSLDSMCFVFLACFVNLKL